MSMHKGFKFSEEAKTKLKRSEISKDRYKLYPESFIGIGSYWKGKKRSEEWKMKRSIARKGKNNPMFGKHLTEEQRQNKSLLAEERGYGKWMIGKHPSEETRKKMSIALKGKTCWLKGGHHSEKTKEKMKGKIPWNYMGGISKTREYKNAQRQNRRGGGKLSIHTIQMIYEDNIKQYGTLTCYLCLQPIEFRKDHLEHKTPLSRGGDNSYINLGIACAKCNMKKHNKTETEYKKKGNSRADHQE
jgi:hypothetical protein